MSISRREWIRTISVSVPAALWERQRPEAAGSDKSFANKRPFSFAAIADIQYCDSAPANNRYYRDSLDRLKRCIEHLNSLRPDFVLLLGDLIDAEFASLERVLTVLRDLTMPFYPVLGNHDVQIEQSRRQQAWRMLGYDRRGRGKGYYDFAHKGWRFVALNGTDVSLLAHRPGTLEYQRAMQWLAQLKGRKAVNAYEWNSGIGPEQVQWLKAALDRATNAGEKAIVFCHYPVFPVSSHVLWNHVEVAGVLEASPATVLYLAGHKHDGDYGVRNGVHYLTLRGMVETPQTAYSVFQVSPDQIRVVGFGREASRELPLAAAGKSAAKTRFNNHPNPSETI
ncbi:MAG: metallophosphoesterase [Candidatus Sumerlaeia bacterium]|nr:metallophosphoesterase [Candidatus Sumerlaeia bacterium]